jgi:agmatine deiminase
MPAEWEKHEATWLTWPHNIGNTWYEGLEKISLAFAQMASALSHGEKVNILIASPEIEKLANHYLSQQTANRENIIFHHWPTNDSWIRDYGPIYVYEENGQKHILDWTYNAWGGKYPAALDNLIPQKIAALQNTSFTSPGLVLEGGSLDVNGKGTLLTTKACLLNTNRNPQFTQAQIEKYLKEYLGITNIIWLGEGIAGDDTDGHVDDIIRFVNPHTIVCAYESDTEDENYHALKENYEQLEGSTNEEDKPFHLVKLPMPDPVYYQGERLPASYANFYIGNAVVLVPTYQCSKDELALSILQEYFPERKVIGIDFKDCILGLGSLHCLSQQEPANKK